MALALMAFSTLRKKGSSFICYSVHGACDDLLRKQLVGKYYICYTPFPAGPWYLIVYDCHKMNGERVVIFHCYGNGAYPATTIGMKS